MAKPTKLPKKEYSEDQLHELGEVLLKAKDIEDEKEAVRAHRETESEQAPATTIGDLIKQQMQNK